MLSGIRAVLFDAVGTLIYPDPSVAEIYCRLGRQFGSPLTPAQIRRRFCEAFARYRPGQWPGGETDDAGGPLVRTSQTVERRRWRRIVCQVFHELDDAGGALFEALWDHFAQSRHWALYDDAAPTWNALADKWLLGIASNYDDRLETVCRGLSPLADCRHLFWSARLGFAKPGRAFFVAIQRQLQLPPEQILLVGNDLQDDFLAGRQAGWRTILLDRSGQQEGRDVIHGLTRLAELLE